MRNRGKVKDFNVLRFIADNAWLSLPEAIEKAFEEGLKQNYLEHSVVSRQQVREFLNWAESEIRAKGYADFDFKALYEKYKRRSWGSD